MAGQFDGKTALLTGAGSGIGRACALAFAREGATVVVADRSVRGGTETVRLIEEAGGAAQFMRCNVSSAAEVEQLVATATAVAGRLDCALNNAGVSTKGPIEECTEEEWDRVIGTNLRGVWLCMKHEILQMRRQGGGAIVNTASLAGLRASPGFGVYAASKHGVIGLTRTAALECAGAGIRINAVCPSATATAGLDLTWRADPGGAQALAQKGMGRMASPDEIAAAVLWLSSDAASFVTGHALPVDGGAMA